MVDFDSRGQMKIQQMAFMLIAVFLFFVLAGVFFLKIQFKDVKSEFAELQKSQAISSLEVIANMPELNYDSGDVMTLDVDKLKLMSGEFGEDYERFWPVASIEVYGIVDCPGTDCTYYEVYDNGQRDLEKYAGFVSICERVRDSRTRDVCEIGKLVVGVIKNEE